MLPYRTAGGRAGSGSLCRTCCGLIDRQIDQRQFKADDVLRMERLSEVAESASGAAAPAPSIRGNLWNI